MYSMRRILSSIMFFCTFAVQLAAQSHKPSVSLHQQRQTDRAVAAFRQDLSDLRLKCANIDSAETVRPINPLYYRLFGPPTFYSAVLDSLFGLTTDSLTAGDEESCLVDAIDEQLVRLYQKNPRLIRYYDRQWSNVSLTDTRKTLHGNISDEVNKVLGNEYQSLAKENLHEDIDDIGLRIQKPNFWKTSGTFGMKFTQNYFSENWYKGGSNTQSMQASLTLQANYNDQRRVTWENRLIMRLGFMTSPGDSCHTFLTYDDKLNVYSKVGVKVAKSWYCTTTAEANTQFMPGYRANDKRTFSNFLSPLDFYFSLGMDFKPSLKNGNTFSVVLSPVSYKFRWLHSENENVHKVYRMVGHDFQKDWGSKVDVNAKFTLVKNLTWKCRAYYFTSYKYTEGELENSLSFAFNKYLSSELNTLWRFDDNRSRYYYDDNLGYFQFKEFFTFGFNYNF